MSRGKTSNPGKKIKIHNNEEDRFPSTPSRDLLSPEPSSLSHMLTYMRGFTASNQREGIPSQPESGLQVPHSPNVNQDCRSPIISIQSPGEKSKGNTDESVLIDGQLPDRRPCTCRSRSLSKADLVKNGPIRSVGTKGVCPSSLGSPEFNGIKKLPRRSTVSTVPCTPHSPPSNPSPAAATPSQNKNDHVQPLTLTEYLQHPNGMEWMDQLRRMGEAQVNFDHRGSFSQPQKESLSEVFSRDFQTFWSSHNTKSSSIDPTIMLTVSDDVTPGENKAQVMEDGNPGELSSLTMGPPPPPSLSAPSTASSCSSRTLLDEPNAASDNEKRAPDDNTFSIDDFVEHVAASLGENERPSSADATIHPLRSLYQWSPTVTDRGSNGLVAKKSNSESGAATLDLDQNVRNSRPRSLTSNILSCPNSVRNTVNECKPQAVCTASSTLNKKGRAASISASSIPLCHGTPEYAAHRERGCIAEKDMRKPTTQQICGNESGSSEVKSEVISKVDDEKDALNGQRDSKKLMDRRKRRKESHNAVERKRRDLINGRLAELASLLPESMLIEAIEKSTAGGTAPHIDLSILANRSTCTYQNNSHDGRSEDWDLRETLAGHQPGCDGSCAHSGVLSLAQSKPNKGIILTKSVEYIKHLHEVCEGLRTSNLELQQQLITIRQTVMGSSA